MSEHEPPDTVPPESAPPAEPGAPSSSASGHASGAPGAKEERRRRRLEGVIPDIVRRAVELGVEKAVEAPDNVKQFVGDLKLPKEIAHYLLAQIDETKNGLFRVVAKEIRDFLEHTNFAGEVQKLLTTVQFEVNTTIRFTPNDGRPRKETRERGKSKSRGDEGKGDRATAPPPGTREGAPGRAGASDDDEGDADEPASEGLFAEDAPASERSSLPKPEVKTAVHVHRDRGDRGDRDDRDADDERDRKRKRDRI